MKLPTHKCALYITHNQHKNDYQSASEWCNENEQTAFFSWRDDESKARAIATDDIWVLQWYPDTPIGFIAIAAPTLEELLTFAEEMD